jgi:hypothetical protein
MRHSVLFLAFALAAIGGAAPSVAQDLQTDRPDVTEGATTMPAGRLQLESGVARESDNGDANQAFGQTLVRYGIVEGLELRVELGSWQRLAGGASGWDGGSLGLKARLVDGGDGVPQTSLVLTAATPLGDDEVAADAWQPDVKVAADWDLPGGFGLGANVGWGRPVEDGRRFDQATWSVSLGPPGGERLGTFLEYFGTTREAPGGDPTHYLDGGLTWALGPDLQVDVYGGAGLVEAATDWFVGAGAAVRF